MRFLKAMLTTLYIFLGCFTVACFINWCVTGTEPQALIMGILAFLVYKKLAIRSGNWDRIRSYFTKQPVSQDVEGAGTKERLITIPLAVAMVIGVAFMIVYEILIQRM